MKAVLPVAAAALLLGGCSTAVPSASAASPEVTCASGTLTGQGSSAQANAFNNWIKIYQVACADATIGYDSVGSGKGVEAFLAGTGDFAGTDSALDATARSSAATRCAGAPALHLPMVVGPVALAYNVAGVADLRLRPTTIAKIFSGAITTWNDTAIALENPEAVLPSTPIRTVHRQDSSGTTDNFTKFLAATAGSAWSHGSGSTWTAPGGTAASGSARVSTTVASTDGAIGYMEYSYADFHNLSMARVGNSSGEYVSLTPETARQTVATAEPTGTGNDLSLDIDYATTESGAYPIVLVTYEIVCSKGTSPQRLALLRGFLGYTVSDRGQQDAARLGYAPLPDNLRTRVEAAVAALG